MTRHPRPGRRRLSRRGLATAIATTLAAALVAPVLAASPAVAAEPTFTISGGGYGHGVGMSQYGAYGMAAGGSDATGIIGRFYTGASPVAVGQVNDLRVLIGSTGEVTLTTANAWTNVYNTGGSGIYGGAPGVAVTLRAVGNGVTVMNGPTYAGGSDVTVFHDEQPMSVSTTGARYKWGTLRVRNIGGSLQLVVQDLTMQEYLYGLAEVPSSWPAAALQAQAIAGRTYALERTTSRRSADPTRTYDLDASTVDQAYRGYEKEAEPTYGALWVQAVNNTTTPDGQSGITALYGGNPITAFYSSSDGGMTEDSGYVFATSLPYLKPVDDPDDAHGNPNYRWTRTYTQTQLTTWFNKYSDAAVGTVLGLQLGGNIGASGRVNKATVTIVGSTATKSISGARLFSIINANAPSSLQLLSTKLSLDAQYSFIANFEAAYQVPGGIFVGGWAIDVDTANPTPVHVYVDSTGTNLGPADDPRPDVGAAYSGYGNNHGFAAVVPATPGTHNVCAYAINSVGSGANALIGCKTVKVIADPFGSFEGVRLAPGGLAVGGWVIDPDTASPTPVHVYVDSTGTDIGPAAGNRPDVGAVFGPWGPGHGFAATVTAAPGQHNVCVYGINSAGPGAPALLGCRSATASSDAFGSLDLVTGAAGQVRVAGWAIDADTANATPVHVYVDNVGTAINTPVSRPDVGAAYPEYGATHGFDQFLTAPPGSHNVCAYAINSVGGGANQLIGCRTVTVT